MAEQTPDSIITTQRNGQTIVAELFFNHSSTETFRDNGLPVPLGRDDAVGGLFCHRRLLSPGAKEGFPVTRKIPLG